MIKMIRIRNKINKKIKIMLKKKNEKGKKKKIE